MIDNSQNPEAEPYGSRLLAEMKAAQRLDFITSKLNYDAIQRLKRANREETVALFLGSSYDLLQAIKTKEAADVVAHLIEESARDQGAAAVIFLGMIH